MSSQLPARPNLEHLKSQAADLLGNYRKGLETSRLRAIFPDRESFGLAQAQLVIAREYGYESWPKLKAYVFSLQILGALKEAIDRDDFPTVRELMTEHPELHRGKLGYGESGPLTWVAECRVPWGQVGEARLEIANWMIEHGSDIHQGGDGPLMRAALMGYRIPMMELLVEKGADVNAQWAGWYPIIFAPCETIQPESLQWLLSHGADANSESADKSKPGTPLDYVIAGYVRSPDLPLCIELLTRAGGRTKYRNESVLAILCGRTDSLEEQLIRDPALVFRTFPELDFGETGGRRLTLRGGTLLHLAAEYGNLEAAKLLLDHGANVNALADKDDEGIGGQTPLFHAVTQSNDWGLPVAKLLLESGASRDVVAKLPGHYEEPEQIVEGTALEYAERFAGGESGAVALLKQGQGLDV